MDCLWTYIGLPGVAPDLWDEQVHSKRRILVLEVVLEDLDLRPQHLWCVTYTADDAETTSAEEQMVEALLVSCGEPHSTPDCAKRTLSPSGKNIISSDDLTEQEGRSRLTAAASSGPAATFIPVESSWINCQKPTVILSSGVQRTSEENGMLDLEELSDGCGDDRHGEDGFVV